MAKARRSGNTGAKTDSLQARPAGRAFGAAKSRRQQPHASQRDKFAKAPSLKLSWRGKFARSGGLQLPRLGKAAGLLPALGFGTLAFVSAGLLMPVALTPASATTDTATYTLSFAATADGTLPADTYSGKVYLSVIAYPAGITADETNDSSAFGGITTMQEMTSDICDAAEVGATKKLQDTRDGKWYWIAKQADNKCWMTQNLDLDLSTSTTLTSAGTNVTSDYTPSQTTSTSVFSSSDYTGQYSYDPGDYYWNGNYSSSSTGSSSSGISGFSDYYVAGATVSATVSATEYNLELSPTASSSDFATAEGTLTVTATDAKSWSVYLSAESADLQSATDANTSVIAAGNGTSANTWGYALSAFGAVASYVAPSATPTQVLTGTGTGTVLNEHYHVGNYYQWCAATAGSCSEKTSNNVSVSASICPAGWKLPTGGTNSSTDFEGLQTATNYTSQTITKSPLYFPPAGFVSFGELYNAGYYGDYWSSTSSSSGNAYALRFFGGGTLYPGTRNLSRYYGRSVRCVAS